jgi:hypothetical protein
VWSVVMWKLCQQTCSSSSSSSSKQEWGVPWHTLLTPRSLLFHCTSLPVYEVKWLSQALQDLQALESYCPRSCIFYISKYQTTICLWHHRICTLSCCVTMTL